MTKTRPLDAIVPATFPAVFVAEPDGTPAALRDATEADLGDGDVVIDVAYSSLNYKDGLAITGTAPVVRTFPMIGGVDLVGSVLSSSDDLVRVGDEVVVTGCGLGETHPGGYARYARVPADWCTQIPDTLSMHTAVAIGTAGLTAMLAFMALERNRSTPSDCGELPLLVTGASGGVGSLAVLFGSRLGYRVAASTGRTHERDYLGSLGAHDVIDRREISDLPPSALGKVRFGAGIDSVGGVTLANLIRMTRPDGAVAACGLAAGAELELTVHPFILRGVTLAGINSVRPHDGDRAEAWRRIAALISDEEVGQVARDARLDEVIALAPAILNGAIRGRTVVDVRS